MILYIIVALTILSFLSWLVLKNKVLRVTLGSISTILLFGAVGLLSLNMSNHYGMEEKTVTSEISDIFTAGDTSSPVNMLIANQIGSDSGNYALVYRDQASDAQASPHFVPNQDDIINSVKKSASYELSDSAKNASIITQKTYWVYKSDFYKNLFELKSDDEDINLISEKTTVELPKGSWVVLSADQAKKLAEKQASVTDEQKAAQKTALETAIKTKLAEYMAQNKNASKEDIEAFTKAETTKLALESINTALKGLN
ncbi:DUF4811 domain-containing protein [Streptococcaceae bacterium ESL0729]|nr:DUF4811 domain-containing protein [Streptococcaceae bacterium ESL0729]